ncbi:MAG TPA: VOC family protein [Acidimicrobiales bacterium]|nr:VOC family protein [Acidimicrobiales bacterium]
MQALGVHHVSINVADLDAAVRFYTDVLGFSVRPDRPELRVDGVWLDTAPGGGAQQVHLIVADVPPAKGQHFAVLVADLDKAVADVRGAGTPVTDPAPVGTSRQAFLSDPDGNLIELHQAR